MFSNIMSQTTNTFDQTSAIITLLTAIVLGLIIGLIHMKTTKYTKNFIITLSVLPILVAVIIMLVNGNLGTSVAILGAFGLIRFRSMPGNSREIISVFYAMTIGLALGCGYIVFAMIITLVVGLILFILSKTRFGEKSKREKIIKISIPENLDYTDVFNETFKKYLDKYELIKMKTTNMGSIFDLTYNITLKQDINEKEFIDEIRVRNGNLTIMINNGLEESEL